MAETQVASEPNSNRKVQEIAAEHFRIAFVTSTNDMAKWNRWGELRIAISGEGLVGRSGIVFLFVEPIAAGAFSDGAEKLTHRQISSSHLIFNAEGGSPHQLLSAQFIFFCCFATQAISDLFRKDDRRDWCQITDLQQSNRLQGDTWGWSLVLVEIKTKVVFYAS